MHFTAFALFIGTPSSLSCVESDLSTEQQLELSEWLQQRWHLGQSGRGTVTSLQISSRSTVGVQQQLDCYCCHLLPASNNSNQQATEDKNNQQSVDGTSAEQSRRFVVCLLSSLIGCLDLYHQELDSFSKQVTARCNFETAEVDCSTLLPQWYDCCVLFINRAVETLRSALPQVIHAAMDDQQVSVVGADAGLERDIRRFCESCSLSELHQESLAEADSRGACTISLRHPEPPHCSHSDESPFSTDFAGALIRVACDDPVALKHIVQEYKMKAIQDLNALKRLLHRAETDHYALYGALQFLRSCGHGAVLLHHCRRSGVAAEHVTSGPLPAHALEPHILATGGFQPRAASAK